MRLISTLLVVSCVYLGANGLSTTIELVHVMFRHGDRTPDDVEMGAFPNYENVNNTWYPIGRGHVTNEGILHMFKLGQKLHSNYRNLFQGVFNMPTYETVRTFTTEYPRTRASALAFLAGLLPPAQQQQWGRERGCTAGPRICQGPELAKLWRPVTYIPDHNLNLAVNLWTNCEAFLNETIYIQSLPEIQDKFAKYHRLIQILSANVGKTTLAPIEVWFLRTLYETQEAAGIKKPTWIKDNWNEINEYTDLFFETMFYSDIQKRFGAGVILKKILDDSKAKARGADALKERKMFVYSGHETTLVPLYAALAGDGGFIDQRGFKVPIHIPEFTATLALELHRSVSSGQHAIRFMYSNGDRNFRRLRRSDCDDPCPLEDLERLTQAITFNAKNINEECNPQSTKPPQTSTSEIPSTFPTVGPPTDPPTTSEGPGSGSGSGEMPPPGFPGFAGIHNDEERKSKY